MLYKCGRHCLAQPGAFRSPHGFLFSSVWRTVEEFLADFNGRQVPQLVENYRSGSAHGVSLTFLSTWFIGDIANLVGAIWAELVPTVIALAIYFCIADVLLIFQCLYYRRLHHQNMIIRDDARQPLLGVQQSSIGSPELRPNSSSPLKQHAPNCTDTSLPIQSERSRNLRAWATNASSICLVCAVGIAGWIVAWQIGLWTAQVEETGTNLVKDSYGAVTLGYLSALAYLGYGRIPAHSEEHSRRTEQSSYPSNIEELAGKILRG